MDHGSTPAAPAPASPAQQVRLQVCLLGLRSLACRVCLHGLLAGSPCMVRDRAAPHRSTRKSTPTVHADHADEGVSQGPSPRKSFSAHCARGPRR